MVKGEYYITSHLLTWIITEHLLSACRQSNFLTSNTEQYQCWYEPCMKLVKVPLLPNSTGIIYTKQLHLQQPAPIITLYNGYCYFCYVIAPNL